MHVISLVLQGKTRLHFYQWSYHTPAPDSRTKYIFFFTDMKRFLVNLPSFSLAQNNKSSFINSLLVHFPYSLQHKLDCALSLSWHPFLMKICYLPSLNNYSQGFYVLEYSLIQNIAAILNQPKVWVRILLLLCTFVYRTAVIYLCAIKAAREGRDVSCSVYKCEWHSILKPTERYWIENKYRKSSYLHISICFISKKY